MRAAALRPIHPHLTPPHHVPPHPTHCPQVLWIVESNAVWRTDFSHLEHEPLSVLINTPAGGPDPDEPLVQVRGRAGRVRRGLDSGWARMGM